MPMPMPGATPSALRCFLAGFGHAGVAVGTLPAPVGEDADPRAILSEAALLLPQRVFAPPGPAFGQHDVWLAAAAHALCHLRYSARHTPVGTRRPLMLAVQALLEDARVERLLAREHPGLWHVWHRFHLAVGGPRDLTFASLAARLARALHDPGYSDPNHWVNKGRALFEACAGQLDLPAPFLAVGAILANDLGQMRVRFDMQQYRVEPGYRDDNSMLWRFDQDRAVAPDQPQLARDALHASAPAGADDAAPGMAPDTQRYILHPEWDCQVQGLRQDWVRVIEMWPEAPDTGASAPLGAAPLVRPMSPRAAPERGRRLLRQLDGEELDLDAAIESRIDLRGGATPETRVFMRHGKNRQGHALLLLLLDLSESSNDRVPGSFTSILDMQKRAANMLLEPGRPYARHGERIALHGFASNGRHEVHYTRIKEFDQPYGARQQAVLTAQRGALSTRIGAALRHAGSCFTDETARNKSILIVTDGRPSDIDVDDPRYLIEDARHAVAQLAGKGIDVFCLTLDRQADDYAHAMFGSARYVIVERAASLAHYLACAWTRLSSR